MNRDPNSHIDPYRQPRSVRLTRGDAIGDLPGPPTAIVRRFLRRFEMWTRFHDAERRRRLLLAGAVSIMVLAVTGALLAWSLGAGDEGTASAREGQISATATARGVTGASPAGDSIEGPQDQGPGAAPPAAAVESPREPATGAPTVAPGGAGPSGAPGRDGQPGQPGAPAPTLAPMPTSTPVVVLPTPPAVPTLPPIPTAPARGLPVIPTLPIPTPPGLPDVPVLP